MTPRTIGTHHRITTTDKIIFIGVLMGSLLVQCMSAPAVGSSKRSTRTADSHQSGVWWQQPCGQPKNEQEPPHHIRHKWHVKLIREYKRMVMRSFHIFQNRYNSTIAEIDKYYRDELSCQDLKEQYNYTWIPKIPNRSQTLHLERNQTQALHRFITDTQKFASIIYQLNKTKLKTEATVNESPRHGIFGSIVNATRQVLCESESLLNEIHPNSPEPVKRITPDYQSARISSTGTDASVTNMCTRDRAVLRAFSNYMKKWRKIFKNAFYPKESSEEY